MKLKELQTILKEQQIDLLLLIHPDPNINYLAQIKPSYSVIKITTKQATILLSNLDHLTPREPIQTKEYKKTWRSDLKEQLKELKEPKIAINKSTLTIKKFESLQKEFPKVEWIDFSEELNNLRLTKTEEELVVMQKAASIADNALANFIKTYKNDSTQFLTELDIALFLEREIRKQGATLSFPTIIATKPRSAIPHHITGNDRLQLGLLLVDFGARYKGYCSDMTRMFSIGEPTEEEKADFNLLLKTQEACIKKAEEFAKTREKLESLDAFAREQLKDKAKFFTHSLGHGVGVKIHEAPKVAKDCTQIIEKNMPFTIEPGIYRQGKWGLRIEDMVFWDGNKLQILTKSHKNLILL